MAQFAVKDFGGEIPRRTSRLLPDQMAERADNVDLAAGPLNGLSQPEFTINLTDFATWPVRKAYRFDGSPWGHGDAWLPLPSEYSSVVRSPLTNDTLHRLYWTNPPGSPAAGAWWSTYDRIAARAAPYTLGFFPVSSSIALSLTTTGGSGTSFIDRSYVFTYIDIYNQESSPSLPSNIVEAQVNATWHIAGFPTGPPTNPTGKNYPAVSFMRLYRTVTGASTGAQFYFVTDIAFGTTTFADSVPDTLIVNNNLLETADWAPPLDGLDGLVGMPGGMLVGFTGSTLHFCEPDRPHTWPAGYDQGVLYDVVGLAVWQQSLIVLTAGFPSTGVGNSPAQFSISQLQAPEPCISRGSIVTDLAGVYYASQNGLIMLNYFGMQNQTLGTLTRNIWLTDFRAASIIACRHRAQYLAINGTGTGFMIDYTEERLGTVHVSPFVNVVSVWNDTSSGDVYIIADNIVYRWDSLTTPALNYRWRSKQFYFPMPVSLGAVQIAAHPSIALTTPAVPDTAAPGDNASELFLPPGVNAFFKLFVDGTLTHTQVLHRQLEIFRLPSGRKAFNWQFEIISKVPIYSVELASTMRELKGI